MPNQRVSFRAEWHAMNRPMTDVHDDCVREHVRQRMNGCVFAFVRGLR